MSNRQIFTLIAVQCALMLSIFTISALFGRELSQSQLPECQEDEFLYPRNYSGPGDNITADYECVHVDEVRSLQ